MGSSPTQPPAEAASDPADATDATSVSASAPPPAPAPTPSDMEKGLTTATIQTAPASKEEKANGAETEPVVALESVQTREDFNPGKRFVGSFVSILIVNFAAALDATSLSVAIPVISRDLGGTAIQAFWSGTSFLLASTMVILPFASASHIFGRKALILIALFLFALGSIVCGVARDFTTLLAGRTVQGAGGGGILCLSEVLITDMVPLRERGKWFGYHGGVWAVGSVTGPLIGGALSQSGQWRWIFWLNLPIIGVGWVVLQFFLKLNRVPGSVLAKLAGFDWLGVLLLTGGGTSFLMPVTWGNVMFPWSSWRSIVPFVLGVVGLVAFVVYEAMEIPKNPIVRVAIFRQRTAVVNYFGTICHGIILWSLLYYLPLYFECVKGYSAVIAGVSMFPQTATIAPMAIMAGVVISKTGRFRWSIWSGWTVATFGLGLLYLLDVGTTVPQWIFIDLVSGLGLGLLFNSLSYGTIAAAEEKDVAFAASMYIFSRAFGQGIGVAIGGAIFQSQFESKLRGYPSLASKASELSQDAAALVEVVRSMPDASLERAMLIQGYSDSVKVIWAVMAGLGFVALILSLLTRKLNITRALETEQGLQEEKQTPEQTPAAQESSVPTSSMEYP